MDAVRRDIAAELPIGRTSTEIRLRGRMLFVARAVWLACALFELILFTNNLLQPLFGRQTQICPITFTCPSDATTLSALQHAQIAPAAYTAYATAFGLLWALIFVGLSVLIFSRVFDQPASLFASFSFLFLGSLALTGTPGLPLALQVFQVEILVFCLGFFLATFPDGRFVPRWSWLIGCTLFVQSIFFQLPGPFNILSWPVPLTLLELVLAYGSPIALQIYRYRRVSTPLQRQQTKWVLFGLLCFLLLLLLAIFAGGLVPTFGVQGALYLLANASIPALAFLLIPLSVTMAVLRSRLWDIDVLINRTLVYGLLTATLVGVYLVLVFAGQTLLSRLLGQNNGVVLVGSTLIVAALFQPLRRRIQQLIDRRFYRRKYDAAKTVEAFSATLRNEVDLSQLSEHLITVVQETMQPTSVSLWLPKSQQKIKSKTKAWVSNGLVPSHEE